jgi:uncharacterized protein (DUF302 family)
MKYYFAKTLDIPFEDALERVMEELQKEGFGVLTEIDVQRTLKMKMDVDFRKYLILGACNPPTALEALQKEERIGLMMPCNVVVRETEEGAVEVSAIDPGVAMQAVGNDELQETACDVAEKLKTVIENL